MRSADSPSDGHRGRCGPARIALGTFALVAAWSLLVPSAALAWKPGGHWVVAEKTAQRLPAGNRIRAAMEKYPGLSYGWGAYGHDVGYGTGYSITDYAPYADYFHYHKAAQFAKRLLQKALEVNPPRDDLVAYAAGWITHATGDFYAHSLFTNPEVGGVFFDKHETIKPHRDLEKWADPYIWHRLGGHSPLHFNHTDFTKPYAFTMPGALRQLFQDTAWEVYGNSPSRSRCGGDATLSGDDFERMTELCYGAMSTAVGAWKAGLFCDLATAEHEMDYTPPWTGRQRKLVVNEAVEKAATHAADLLSAASEGDYSGFHGSWNLDVGPGDRNALNTLVVEVETANKTLAATNEDVYFWLKNHLPGDDQGYERKLDISEYNDFGTDDRDYYYVYIDPANPVMGLTPSTVTKIGLHAVESLPGLFAIFNDWEAEKIRVWMNGELVEDTGVGEVFTKGDPWWSKGVSGNWSSKVPGPVRDQVFAGDFNGDGKDDVLEFAYLGRDACAVALFQSDGKRFSLSFPAWFDRWWEPGRSKGVVGDFDGDGSDEFGIFYHYGGATPPGEPGPADSALWVWDVSPTGLSGRIAWTANSGFLAGAAYAGTVAAGDFFGDEREEIAVSVFRRDPITDTTISQTGFIQVAPDKQSSVVTGPYDGRAFSPAAADFDGDGRDELVDFVSSIRGDATMRVIECDGRFQPTTVWTGPSPTWVTSRLSRPIAGDIDGDGKVDVGAYYDLGSGSSALHLFSFSSPTQATPRKVWQSTGWGFGAIRPIAGDFDGDRRAEPLVFFDYGGWELQEQGIWVWPRLEKDSAINKIWYKRIGGWKGTGVPRLTDPMDTTVSEPGTPANPPTSFAATPGNRQVALSWGKPADSVAVRVLRSKAAYSGSPTPADGQTQVYEGPATIFTDAGLAPGTYFYTAFSRNQVGNWSVAATARATVVLPLAKLGTPRLSPATPRRKRYFAVSGSVTRHTARSGVYLYMYRRVGRRWRLHKRLAVRVAARAASYRVRYRVPYAGRWYVRAYHKDAGHRASLSRPRVFRVR